MGQLAHLHTVLQTQLHTADLDQVGLQFVLKGIQRLFIFANRLAVFLIVDPDEAQGQQGVFLGQAGHIVGALPALLNGKGWGHQKALLYQCVVVCGSGLRLVCLVPHDQAGQLFQLLAKGEQQHSAKYIECGVNGSNVCAVHRFIQKGKVEDGIGTVEQRHTAHHADDVKG